MKKVGLFFGSFNPVHVGHLIIANYMADQTDLDEIWMVVSPHNPLKEKKSLAKDYDRLHLVNIAIEDNLKIKSSKIEFDLPKPSFTIDTLIYLKEKHPNISFVLIMGGDNLGSFHKWKNYQLILRDYQIYVYQRPSYDLGDLQNHPNIKLFEAPLMQISSSYIRNCIKNKLSIQFLVTEPVYNYILETNLYKN